MAENFEGSKNLEQEIARTLMKEALQRALTHMSWDEILNNVRRAKAEQERWEQEQEWKRTGIGKHPCPKQKIVGDKKLSKTPALEGNDYFKEKEYQKALEAYTTAIEQNRAESARLFANRALTYLQLDNPKLALKDADDGLNLDPTNIKLLYRKGKALLGLKHFDEAVNFLMETTRKYDEVSKSNEFLVLIEQAKRMQHESKTGEYDVLKMFDEAQKSQRLDGHADYVASDLLELKQIKGKGRGWVAKKAIDGGTLLIACKAFAFVDASEHLAFPGNALETGSISSVLPLLSKICEKLSNNPELGDHFYKLSAGPGLGSLEAIDHANPIDVRRICGIICTNTYAAEASIFDIEKEGQINGEGLWIHSSYINHSCIDCNCLRYVIGDFIFIRAKKSINQGEVLVIEYISPVESYEKRRQLLQCHFGFQCTCRLCKFEQRNLEDARNNRYQEIFKMSEKVNDIALLKELLRDVLQCRPDKSLNLLAPNLQQDLAFATSKSDPAYSLKSMKEAFQSYMETGNLRWALHTARFLANMLKLRIYRDSKKETAKWVAMAKELAKFVFGDERAVDLIGYARR